MATGRLFTAGVALSIASDIIGNCAICLEALLPEMGASGGPNVGRQAVVLPCGHMGHREW